MERAALDRERLRRELVPARWTRIEVVERTHSTNADVADAARRGEPEGLVVAAEHQVAGRGRLGRHWHAPPRSGLAVSALLRPVDVAAADWTWLPLLAGVAVHDALLRVADVPARVKWPNDVLVAERKVAGILVELVETPGGPAAVVGIGVNVSLGADELPVPEATSLFLTGGRPVDRTTLLLEVLKCLSERYVAWRGVAGAAALRAAYQRACGTIGQRVEVSLADGSMLLGTATGIDTAGRLRVDTAGGTRVVGTGDVIHLRRGS
ncbi:MAG: biotin--[acetyl-CoA-carboxylase] ligase [Nocardioidaceae bacterium]|nr:biotin--[acetyl-CoA-carboxylase] ligase [Nocardioidaceae bacterium]